MRQKVQFLSNQFGTVTVFQKRHWQKCFLGLLYNNGSLLSQWFHMENDGECGCGIWIHLRYCMPRKKFQFKILRKSKFKIWRNCDFDLDLWTTEGAIQIIRDTFLAPPCVIWWHRCRPPPSPCDVNVKLTWYVFKNCEKSHFSPKKMSRDS